MTGCQGELVNEEFKVFIEDVDGNVLLDEMVKSHDNGFIDLWLPRDKNYEVTIEVNGKVAKAQLSTFENDPTCITTMQLL
ncbi:hypothetical protein EJF36_06005 [Bacillus sp. HMF5848]|nr:hypothetical protein EJF36_06005 [Bacillus sp. HMF5848]